jgi:hypothetical protein
VPTPPEAASADARTTEEEAALRAAEREAASVAQAELLQRVATADAALVERRQSEQVGLFDRSLIEQILADVGAPPSSSRGPALTAAVERSSYCAPPPRAAELRERAHQVSIAALSTVPAAARDAAGNECNLAGADASEVSTGADDAVATDPTSVESERSAAVVQFMEFTGSDATTARRLLEESGWSASIAATKLYG